MARLQSAPEIIASRADWVRENAENERWEIPSPCVSVCRMDPERAHCVGCLRTLDEIASWAQLDRQAKRSVWQRLAQRASLEQTKS